MVSFTYTTILTDACVREIDRPEKIWPRGIYLGATQEDEKEGQEQDIIKEQESKT